MPAARAEVGDISEEGVNRDGKLIAASCVEHGASGGHGRGTPQADRGPQANRVLGPRGVVAEPASL